MKILMFCLLSVLIQSPLSPCQDLQCILAEHEHRSMWTCLGVTPSGQLGLMGGVDTVEEVTRGWGLSWLAKTQNLAQY